MSRSTQSYISSIEEKEKLYNTRCAEGVSRDTFIGTMKTCARAEVVILEYICILHGS